MPRLKVKRICLLLVTVLGMVGLLFLGNDDGCERQGGPNALLSPSRAEGQYQSGSLIYELTPRSVNDLTTFAVPNTVFYMWCDNKTFDFRHFLSVKSVWKYLEPETLEINYYHPPLSDDYNDWLGILNSTIPNLVLTKMNEKCDPCRNSLLDYLHQDGGIYVSEDTILFGDINQYRMHNVSVFLGENDSIKLIAASPKLRSLRSIECLKNYKFRDSTSIFKTANCTDMSKTSSNASTSDMICANNQASSVVPRDLFTSQDKLTEKLRDVAYGVKQPLVPRSDNSRIPKVIHYIWYRKANMTFMMYLSLLSSLHIVKPERIYIHGGQDLEGHYWDKLKVHPKIQTVHRTTFRYIYGNMVLFTHHISDIMRADILYKYGGIYIDWDVLWLQPVDELISTGYDVIVNVDHMARDPFPDSINMGVVLAKPRAKYIDIWRKTYKQYRQRDFFYNPIRAPYKVYEQYPTLVKIEPRLQVMCYQLKCHPAFHPDYKNYVASQPFNWRTDVYAIHFTHPDPDEFQNQSALDNGKGMFADIGKFILDSSRG